MMADFNYDNIIGQLNFMGKSMWPDIAYVVHQCTRFSQHPECSHAEAVKRIGHFFMGIHTHKIRLASFNSCRNHALMESFFVRPQMFHPYVKSRTPLE